MSHWIKFTLIRDLEIFRININIAVEYLSISKPDPYTDMKTIS
jgi:hypothetical protein